MKRNINTEAVVLTATDVGEEDRILTFLTPETGLLRAAATSARNLKKGRAATLDLFVLVRLDVNVPAKEGKLKRIGTVKLLDPFLGIRADYQRLCAASYIGQTVAHCVQEDDPARGTWELVLNCLGRLDAGGSPYTVLLPFEVRFLGEMGVLPELSLCFLCGRDITGPAYMDASAGGILHQECSTREYRGALTAGDLSVLRFLSRKSLKAVSNLSLGEEDARRIFQTLHPFSVHHLGYESRALGMIKS